MENIIKEKTWNESENFALIQWKQKFKAVDYDYDNAPSQAVCTFEYTGYKKKVKLEWKTNKDKEIRKRGAENVYKNEPAPGRAAKSVKDPSLLFKCFFAD